MMKHMRAMAAMPMPMPMWTMSALVLIVTMWTMPTLVRTMTMWSMSVATRALAVSMTMTVVVTTVMLAMLVLRAVGLRGWSCGAGSFVYQLGKSLLVEGGVDKPLNCMSKGARLEYGVLNGIGIVVNAVTNGTKVPDIKGA